jgi:hypothetical protein
MKDTKREMTIEELEKEYTKITEERQNIEKVLKQKKQDEEARRTAQLALDKEKRRKEIEEAYDNYITLVNTYVRDYGSYSTITSTSNDLGRLFSNFWEW